jgi:hypothetical protein
MELRQHPEVGRWLADLDDVTRAAVDEGLEYLEQHGRAAVLPDVRLRIQTSRHYPDMGEVRVYIDDDHVYRVLFVFDAGERPVLVFAGNKAGIGNPWYDANVPIADARFDTYVDALRKSKEGPRR